MMTRIRTAIVDDESLARRGIRARLANRSEFEVVAEADEASAGVVAVSRHRPELLFLDIEMPDADGFAVLAQLPPGVRPLVIFVTAHDDRALQAFRVEAFDYLLKPLDDAQFSHTLNRVIAHLAERRPARSERIVVRSRGRSIALDPEAIDWIQSDGDYVRIHTGRNSYLHHATLTSMAATLTSLPFARVHRSAIINVGRVRSLERLTNGDHEIRLTTGVRVRLSRTYREALIGQLGPGF